MERVHVERVREGRESVERGNGGMKRWEGRQSWCRGEEVSESSPFFEDYEIVLTCSPNTACFPSKRDLSAPGNGVSGSRRHGTSARGGDSAGMWVQWSPVAGEIHAIQHFVTAGAGSQRVSFGVRGGHWVSNGLGEADSEAKGDRIDAELCKR